MENILNDSQKIGLYAQIQKELNDLNPNCSDEELCHVIDLIPESYLNQKDELMMICQLFAYYPRNSPKYVRKNAINLFDKLIDPIKSSLQGESSFFWNIFGGLYYFKHIMYDNGLISIDTIVRESLYDRTGAVSEYFYPELFEYKPELFEKELQRKVKKQLSKSEIEEFKDLRKKHIKWLRESNDYNDEIYREIEKNRLRLSIKTDDIDTFQSILSNSNMSIDSQIIESVIENSYFQPAQVSLIEYAIEFNSIKIFKYLLMNDAKIEMESIFNSIRNRNYEIIHLVESKILEKFKEFSLIDSLSCWNYELAIYSMDNYDFTLDEDAEITTEKEEKIFEIIKEICYSLNFQFLESIFLPFLKKNPDFVQKNINEIIINTFFDQSTYFTKEFMKCQGININYHSRLNEKQSLLCEALRRKNKKAAELLLKNPKIDIINPCCESFSPFQFACGSYSDLSIFSLFFKNPNFDINWRDSLYDLTALDYCILCGNFMAIEAILTNFPDYNENIRSDLLYHCFNHNYLMTLKLILKHLEKSNVNKILESTRNNKKYSIVLHQIVQEINDDT